MKQEKLPAPDEYGANKSAPRTVGCPSGAGCIPTTTSGALNCGCSMIRFLGSAFHRTLSWPEISPHGAAAASASSSRMEGRSHGEQPRAPCPPPP